MKIKRYIGKTNQEAIGKVRNDLGRDAVIISTRKIRKQGLKGLFTKPLVEVVATIDDCFIPTTSSDFNANQIQEKVSNEKIEKLEAQVNSVEDMIKNLVEEVSENNQETYETYETTEEKLISQLINIGIGKDYALKIANKVLKFSKEFGTEIKTTLNIVMSDMIKESQPTTLHDGQQKKLLYIGPTGVGKTTTLAKMAALFSIKEHLNVGLITTDTFRIAAVDQLKMYADILDIPLSVVYSPNEISQALDHHQDKDTILIDTAGKGLKDTSHEAEIRDLINKVSPNEIYLVISANMSYESCKKVIERYSFIKEYKIIFTKLDDVDNYSVIFNSCLFSNKPLSYITDGQNVPDDIKVADTNDIINRILESVNI